MSRNRATVLAALGGVAVAALLFVMVLSLAGSGKARRHLAPSVFKVGSAHGLATVVDRTGPQLFQDPLGGTRDIFVQHLGGTNWTAFDARPVGSPRRCVLRWRPGEHQFVDPCTEQTYPPDGAGLTVYPATVDSQGALVVDLRAPRAPPPVDVDVD